MKFKIYFSRFVSLLALSLVLFTYNGYAQVTIGDAEPPAEGALLQLKQNYSIVNDNMTNSQKGFLFPRVKLEALRSLSPLVDSATEQEKQASIGMLVFNTHVEPSLNLGLGIYMWNGSQWVLSSDATGDALFDAISPDNITVNGAYFKGEPLNKNNSLTITFIVQSPGRYEVFASTDNGYLFSGSGQFYVTGKQIVEISGSGIPLKSTDLDLGGVLDDLTIRIGTTIVHKENKVDAIPAAFSVNCATIGFKGDFKPDVLLTSANYITIQLNSNPSAAGAVYKITTDEMNGYSFAGTGTLTGIANQTAYLYPTNIGVQKPLVVGTDYFTVTTNSSISSNTCNIAIPVVGPPLKLYTYGTYGSFTTYIDAVKNKANYFSPSGICKVESVTRAGAADFAGSKVLDTQYDGTLFTYNSYYTTAGAQGLIDYVNAGKAAYYCIDDGTAHISGLKTILSSLFGVPQSSILVSSSKSAESSIFVSEDTPFTKGPFGNISGKTMKVDGAGNFGVIIDSPDFIPVAKTSDGYSRIFYHKTKGFLCVGDGGSYASADEPTKEIFLANIIAWMNDIKNQNK